MEADIASQSVGLGSSVDFSLWSLFLRADIIVKSVIVLLIAASIYTWAIIIEKFKLFKKINLSTQEFEEKFWKSRSAESFYNNLPANIDDPMSNVFKKTMQVVLKSRSRSNLNEKLSGLLESNIENEVNKLEKNYSFLATVGSTAPFIGLFGTVYGIMNSFSAIATSKSTNLTVVAPGIAEALFATAIGLFAAIPAVMFYNKISSDIARVTSNLENFSDEFINYFSRQIDAQMVTEDVDDNYQPDEEEY